jgi:hypothetical protein
MMTIHMREYHFEETKQKESMTFTLQIPWIVLVKMQNCTSSSSSLLIQILTVFSYFQLFSVFFSSVGFQFLVEVLVPLSPVSLSSVERRGYCSVPLNFNMDIATATRTMHVLVDYARSRT